LGGNTDTDNYGKLAEGISVPFDYDEKWQARPIETFLNPIIFKSIRFRTADSNRISKPHRSLQQTFMQNGSNNGSNDVDSHKDV